MGLRAKGTVWRAGRSRPAEERERASYRAATNSLRFASVTYCPDAGHRVYTTRRVCTYARQGLPFRARCELRYSVRSQRRDAAYSPYPPIISLDLQSRAMSQAYPARLLISHRLQASKHCPETNVTHG